MSIFGYADATPTDPKGQFSARYGKGMGVAHRNPIPGQTGLPALFANTPLEAMNRREFVCYWQEFIDNMDCSHVQNAAGEPGALWELAGLGGATPTFDILPDCQNGVAALDVGASTDNLGAQIQLYPANVTATGELVRPAASTATAPNQQIVAWCMSGKMTYPLTSSWFIGLAEDDATGVITNAGVMGNDHYIGFLHVEDATAVTLVQQGNAGADLVITPLVDLWTPEDSEDPLVIRELGLRIEGNDKMFWYLNGVCIGTTYVGEAVTGGTVEAFGDGMTPTVCVFNGDTIGGNGIVYIDYHGFQMSRVLAPTGT